LVKLIIKNIPTHYSWTSITVSHSHVTEVHVFQNLMQEVSV